MKRTIALLFAGNGSRCLGLPSDLMPVLGKSLLQRAVEALVDVGVHEIHVINRSPCPAMAQLLGDGRRWGCSIRIGTCADDDALLHYIDDLELSEETPCWLVDGRCVPADTQSLGRLHREAGPTALTGGTAAQDSAAFEGWACVPAGMLQNLMRSRPSMAVLSGGPAWHDLDQQRCDDWLDGGSPAALLATLGRLLEAGEAVVLGRSRSLHRHCYLEAPLHIGDAVRVERGARIGPKVALGDAVLVRRGASISNSLILPHSYVGEDLELRDTIVRGNRLYNVRLGTAVEISDPQLLSALQHDGAPAALPRKGWRRLVAGRAGRNTAPAA